jgi:6-phosphogluconolactonase (cycloisomerase 2 family)
MHRTQKTDTLAPPCQQPDNKFITVSSRNEKSLEFTLADGTTVASDPLVTFKIDPASGALEFVQEAPAGGVNPRHFSFNKDGTLVASALQSDSRIVVFERDVATGKIGKAIAEGNVEGFPNFVIFKE